MSHLDRIPGLVRMITVDNNTLPGRLEELPLDDHTVVLAKNGSGKTSLIQLVPIFYGERMSSVINSHERDNFIHHYLPRDSSYLAFEYRNHEGDIRSVVMHSDPSKEKIQYRFLRGGLSASMFCIENDDESISFISNAGFDNRLRDLSVEFAPRLITSTKAYRGIIQGRIDDGTESRDRAYHRQLANEYGMSTAKAPLTGVEQLLTQMLRNNVSMKNLLGVVARQATETGQESFKLLGDSSKEQIAAWPKTFIAYRKVMDAEPKARELLATSHRISQHKDDIRERFDALQAFEEDFILEVETLETRLKTLNTEKGVAQRSFETAIQALSDKIAGHRAEVGTLGAEIARINAAGAALVARGAENAQVEVDRLPALEADIETATARHKLLTSKGEDIISRFDAERMALRDRSALDKTAAASAHDTAVQEIEQQMEVHGQEVEQRLAATDKEGRNREVELRADIDAKTEEHTELRMQRSALQPDADIALRKSSAQASLDEARQHIENAKNRKNNAAEAFKDADHTWQMATRNLRDADRMVETARATRDAVEVEYNPKDGSLLSFLRRNQPDWGDRIGKVIHPELLQKTNLSPDLTDEASDSLFGLLLDLDKIDVPPHADDTLLEARMMKASDAVAEAEKKRADCDAALTKASRLRKKAEDENATTGAALGVAENKYDIAKKACDTIQDAFERHLQEKGASLTRDIDRVKGLIDQSRARLTREAADLHRRLEDIRAEGRGRMDQLKARKESLISGYRASIAQIDTAMASAEAALKDDQNKALSAGGLDAGTIASLKDEIDALIVARDKARKARSLAEEWARHQDVVLRLPELEARKSQEAYLLKQETSALDAKKEEREVVMAGIADQITAAETSRETVSLALHKVSATLETAPEYVNAEAARGTCYEQGYETALQQLGNMTQRLAGDQVALRNMVKVIAGIFRNCGDLGIASYLDSKTLGDYGNSWVPPIIDWYEFENISYRDTLMQGIGMIVEPMNIAYHALHKADREIAGLNRKLSEAIRVNEGFPHVRDVRIAIRSGITEQPSWPLMEEVNRAHTAWKNSPSAQPPEELIDALEAFLGFWENGKEPVLRLEDMIYLDGHMTEGGNLRRFSRNTNLSELSSTGNIMILRLILFTALLSVMRRGRKVRLVWSVDEMGSLDIENSQSLLKMLHGNDIVLLTAAPNLDRRVKESIRHHMRIDKKVLYRLGSDVRNGIREWIADDQLDYPEVLATEDETSGFTDGNEEFPEGDAA